VYLIEPYQSPRFGSVYIVSGGRVSQFKSSKHERYAILFHGANKVQQLQGCLAPGLSWSGDFLQHSQSALKLMMNELNGETAMLFISGLEQHQ
jgi:hypothetical protein